MGAQGDAQSKLQEFAEKYSMLNQEHQNLVQAFDNVTKVCYLHVRLVLREQIIADNLLFIPNQNSEKLSLALSINRNRIFLEQYCN